MRRFFWGSPRALGENTAVEVATILALGGSFKACTIMAGAIIQTAMARGAITIGATMA